MSVIFLGIAMLFYCQLSFLVLQYGKFMSVISLGFAYDKFMSVILLGFCNMVIYCQLSLLIWKYGNIITVNFLGFAVWSFYRQLSFVVLQLYLFYISYCTFTSPHLLY